MASEKKPFSWVFGNCLDDLWRKEKQSISDCSVKLAILIRYTNLFLLWGMSSGHITEQHEQDKQEHFSSWLERLCQPSATFKQAPAISASLRSPVTEQKYVPEFDEHTPVRFAVLINSKCKFTQINLKTIGP